MDVCYVGRQDADTEARDEEVVSCCHEEGGKDYEGGLDCVWWLVFHQYFCFEVLGEGRTISSGFLIDTPRTIYPKNSKQAPMKTTMK
jgi:hypothetical protein